MPVDLLDPVETGRHAVQWFTREDALVSTVSRFAGGGLAGGDAVLVLATPAHLASFAASMEDSGVELDVAVAQGRYRELDAEAALEDYDLPSFGAVARDAVEELSAHGPVRVYGEMVAVLWAAGRSGDALELESFWNALMRRMPFTLLCAYDGAAREVVNAAHDAVVPSPGVGPRHPGRAVARFEATPRAVPLARAFVGRTLRAWGLHAEPATLVATELATNALEHSGQRFSVSVSRIGDAVRLAVADRSTAPLPAPTQAPDGATDGRGLTLVDALSRRWGCDPGHRGKTVWALVDASAG